MKQLLIAVAFIVGTSSAFAQAPDSLSFQGFVTDTGGAPINNPSVSVIFKLYEGASEIWSETQPSVKIEGGVFNVLLGSVTPLNTVRFNRPLSLGIQVGGDPEMSPRTPLAAAAYAKALPGLYAFYRDEGNRQGYNVIGGGANNVVGTGVVGVTIGGGGGISLGSPVPNSVLGNFATVGGGADNTASGSGATVGGGFSNTASGDFNPTVGGGGQNTASDYQSTVSGGLVNTASGRLSTVGGGSDNTASGPGSTVGGGRNNTAGGDRSTVPGGWANSALGLGSFAAGWNANANHDGTFVWSDQQVDAVVSTGQNQFLIRAAGGVAIGTNSPRGMLTLRGPDEKIMGPSLFFFGNSSDQHESGRIRFVEGTASTNFRGAYIHYDGNGNRLHIGVHNSGSNDTLDDINIITIERSGGDLGIKRNNPSHPLHVGTSTSNGNGAHVTDSGIWTDASSRTFKMDFADLDKAEVLKRVAQLPVAEWSYKGHNGERHIGPVAEDFYQTFGLGSDDKYIGGSDASGVALAAIQGLYELVQEQQAEIDQMRAAMARAGLR